MSFNLTPGNLFFFIYVFISAFARFVKVFYNFIFLVLCPVN